MKLLINIINYWDIKNGEYEIRNVNSFNNSKTNDESNEGYAFNVNYNKKYDGVFSPYEEIKIKIEANGPSLGMISITNIPFDNNELILSSFDTTISKIFFMDKSNKLLSQRDCNIVLYFLLFVYYL